MFANNKICVYFFPLKNVNHLYLNTFYLVFWSFPVPHPIPYHHPPIKKTHTLFGGILIKLTFCGLFISIVGRLFTFICEIRIVTTRIGMERVGEEK